MKPHEDLIAIAPRSLLIIEQPVLIESHAKHWIFAERASRYASSSDLTRGVSFLHVFCNGQQGWAISSRKILARWADLEAPSEFFLLQTSHGYRARSLPPEKSLLHACGRSTSTASVKQY